MAELTQEDIEFNKLLEDKRYKEIYRVLQLMLSEISKPKEKMPVIDYDAATNRLIKALQECINNLPVSKNEPVNVEVNQREVVTSIEEFSKNITMAISQLISATNKKKEWAFHINRFSNGQIESVEVKQI